MSDDRALIFKNLLNGVPIQQVCRDFHKTESEVNQIFSFVLRKIKNYCWLRSATKVALPMVHAGNLEEAKKYRIQCLSVLPKLNLNKDSQYKDFHSEVITPDNALQIARNLNT